jgi:hypothetical protein
MKYWYIIISKYLLYIFSFCGSYKLAEKWKETQMRKGALFLSKYFGNMGLSNNTLQIVQW